MKKLIKKYLEFLNESFNIEKYINKKEILDNIESTWFDSFNGPEIVQEFINVYDIDNEELDDNLYLDNIMNLALELYPNEFRNYWEDKKEEIYFNLVSELDKFQKSNELTLYRSIVINDEILNQIITGAKKTLGVYWSYKKENAIPHFGYNHNYNKEIIITSRVSSKYIDLQGTLNAWSNGSTGEEETEIRLIENSPLTVLEIEVEHQKINLKVNNYLT